jgi:hypothetical protein
MSAPATGVATKITTATTIYETPLARIVASPETWGIVVVFFGNFEVVEAKTAINIINWFTNLAEKAVAFDLRNTLSIDDGALGLLLVLKGIAAEKQISVAVLTSNHPTNKINLAFKNVSRDGSLKIYHSLHTFALSAAGVAAKSA